MIKLKTNPFDKLRTGSQKSKAVCMKGSYLPVILLLSVVFITLASSVASIAMANLKEARHNEKLISSLEVSEAGINYYMWHLSHDNTDYCDGNICNGLGPFGPFTHQFTDSSNKVIGSYDLYVTPPTTGDAVITVKSVGRLVGSKSERVVIAEVGMPSFAKYSFLTDSECWFGAGETTNGPVHSNAGVHFDGVANGVVSSSSKTYKPSNSFGGDGGEHDGVWGDGGPKGFWIYPVPSVDFNKISVDMVNMKVLANNGGIYLGSSGSLGYYIKLQTNDKISVYRVSSEKDDGIIATYLQDYDLPGNGMMYVADNVWVDGTFNNKITIAAEITTGNSDAKIKIKDNLLYSTKDGSANIGLIAESNIEVPRYAINDIEIDAAMLAQKGHVWFPYSSGYIKNSISIYGSISTNLYWTWSWINGSGNITSGYRMTTQTYDPYLTLSPPPQFPTTGSFAILSWREE